MRLLQLQAGDVVEVKILLYVQALKLMSCGAAECDVMDDGRGMK